MSYRLASLAAGLRWLYDTEQPYGALIHPGGALLPATGTLLPTADNRTFGFAPVGARQRPVVVIDVTKVEWIDCGPNAPKKPANPLAMGELEALAEQIAALGFEVDGMWNGHPGITGSVGLKRPAHPTLLAAVDIYRAGCPEHSGSVFCQCSWYSAGNSLVVLPTVASAAASVEG